MRRLLLPALVLSLSACGDDITELSRTPSPVGGLEAVVAQMKGGDSDPYVVVLSKPGENTKKGGRVLLADKGTAPVVEWRDADHLVIRCDGARVWTYRNFWTSPNGGATVSVGLECGQQGWR